MKYILLTFFTWSLNFGFAQCDEFSNKLFELTVNKDYQKLDTFLMPIDQKRKIMHWPNDSSSNSMLQNLQDELKSHFIKSSNALHDTHEIQGLNYSTANYSSCSQTEGKISVITVQFKIDSIFGSFKIQTIQTDNIYIGLPINYQSQPISSTAFTIIDGKKYHIFRARPIEREQALSAIIKQTDYEKNDLIYSNGLKKGGKSYICYLVSNSNKSTNIIVELGNLNILKTEK